VNRERDFYITVLLCSHKTDVLVVPYSAFAILCDFASLREMPFVSAVGSSKGAKSQRKHAK
jgi:hypothetical protein